MDLVEAIILRELGRHPKALVPQAPQQLPTTQAQPQRDPSLWRACCRFEGLLLEQLLQAMQRTIPSDGPFSLGFAGDLSQMMLAQAIADTASSRTPLGIAQWLYDEIAQAGANAADSKDKGGRHADRRA